MSRRRCPECGTKLPYAARSCTCGWTAHRPTPGTRRSRRGWLYWAVGLLVALALALQLAPRVNPAALAHLYARFAFNYLPERFSSFAPTQSAEGAYLYCAKRVVKQVRRGRTVETFPSISESQTTALSEGRYRVESYVEQRNDDGEVSRQLFICTVRYARGHWELETLAMGASTAVRHAAEE